MANAYSTIADGGLEHSWYVVQKVTRASDGEVLYTAPKTSKRAISSDIASNVSYALQQTVKGGTGAYANNLGRPAAGKTGTATDQNGDVTSSWFVGYTPQVSTAVMYVRGDGRKSLEGYLNPFYGATYPTKTWTAIMKRDMDGLDVEDFPPPANVDGKAPDSGHDPYTPPPPKPTKTKRTQAPPTTQGPAADGFCDPAYGFPQDPDCQPPGQQTPTPTPTCTLLSCPSDSPSPSNPGGGPGNNRVAPSDYYARQE